METNIKELEERVAIIERKLGILICPACLGTGRYPIKHLSRYTGPIYNVLQEDGSFEECVKCLLCDGSGTKY